MKNSYPFDHRRAVTELKRNDRRMGALIERVGSFAMRRTTHMTPFQALLRSIVYQQLSGIAASSIHKRVLALFPNRYPSARFTTQLDPKALQAAGMSRAKIRAIKDLAAKCTDRLVPNANGLKAMSDDEMIECLQQVHGVGVWTVQMLLMFYFARPDVLPAGDLGVRKGFMVAYGLHELPDPEELLRHGECWRPYRTVASWYLWRANDL